MFSEVPLDAIEATEFVDYMDPRARPYLQDINLFWHRIDTIRRYFYPSARAVDALLELPLPDAPRLGVHVRRGDNVIDPGVPNKSDYHLCPDLDYYRRGVQALGPLVDSPLLNGTICVSDDIAWCKENIKEVDYYGNGLASPKEHEPTYLSEVPQDWLDLFTLMTCNYFVLSGSTFGIWGAILSGSSIVVRPDKVYGPLLSYINEELLFPADWKVIPHAA